MPKSKLRDVVSKRSKTSKIRKKRIIAAREFREANKDAISEERKKRYQTDPEYAAACKKRAMESYERKQKAIREMRAAGIVKPTRDVSKTKKCCPTCFRPLPVLPKPMDMAVAGKYQVRFYPIGILALHIGKSARTVINWLETKVMPECLFRNAAGRRHWTQDEVEMYMRVCSKYDLRPPVSFEKSGFTAEMHAEWQKLARHHGINPSLYTEKTPYGHYKRPDVDLPQPITQPIKGIKDGSKKTKTAA